MTHLDCHAVDDLLAGYVLTALEANEILAVDRHLATCSRHLEVLGDLSRASDMLLYDIPERHPRPELKARIMDFVRAEAAPLSVGLGWSNERLAIGSHVCVFHSDQAGLKESMAFLRDGLDQPEEFGVVFADEKRFGPLGVWLQEGYSGSVAGLIERGKLAMIPGAASSDALIAGIGARLDRALADGYKLIRLLGFIGWEQPGWPDTQSIVEFERRVNQVVHSYPVAVVCTYDVSGLGGLSLIEGGLRNHPIAIIGNRIVRENPFYLAA